MLGDRASISHAHYCKSKYSAKAQPPLQFFYARRIIFRRTEVKLPSPFVTTHCFRLYETRVALVSLAKPRGHVSVRFSRTSRTNRNVLECLAHGDELLSCVSKLVSSVSFARRVNFLSSTYDDKARQCLQSGAFIGKLSRVLVVFAIVKHIGGDVFDVCSGCVGRLRERSLQQIFTQIGKRKSTLRTSMIAPRKNCFQTYILLSSTDPRHPVSLCMQL